MNSFGNYFRISLFGESHGQSIGVIIDGVPAGIDISQDLFFNDLAKRKTGSKGTSTRIESDIPKISSGIFEGKTTGSPIMILFENQNQDSSAYSANSKYCPRPGHSDFPAQIKYGGFNDYRGGGHFSGRLTLALVAAGVIAKQLISSSIDSQIIEISGKKDFAAELDNAITNGDSLGGIIETTIKNVPVGLGEPFFGSIESMISAAVFSIPGVKGIEFGAGFASARMLGSEFNDQIIDSNGETASNNSGGINGGLSNGNDIVFRTAIRPSSSIAKVQKTIDLRTNEAVVISTIGRHDACFALRVPPVIDAVVACVLADLSLSPKSSVKQ